MIYLIYKYSVWGVLHGYRDRTQISLQAHISSRNLKPKDYAILPLCKQ